MTAAVTIAIPSLGLKPFFRAITFSVSSAARIGAPALRLAHTPNPWTSASPSVLVPVLHRSANRAHRLFRYAPEAPAGVVVVVGTAVGVLLLHPAKRTVVTTVATTSIIVCPRRIH